VEGPVGIPVHTADLVALMEREGTDRVSFVGHSLGAMIGVYLAAHHPDRVSRLVLVDGGSDVTDEVDALLSPVVERLEQTHPSREAYVDYLKSSPSSRVAGTSASNVTSPGTSGPTTARGATTQI
jgi:pimeloyl-ACP methyl ester carboxylesterase